MTAWTGRPGGLPRVVRGARAELRLVDDDARVPPDLLGALGMPEQVRVVAALPDEDEVGRRHEVRDERAALRRARERVGGDAEPAGVVAARVVGPELFLGLEADVLFENGAALELVAGHRSFSIRIAST